MRTVTVQVDLYTFKELKGVARETALEDHRHFLMSLAADENEYSDYENDDEVVIENILANGYVYFEDGETANVVTYCGAHPKAGITEFKFMGRTYTI